jgi:hypothetical protein
MIKNFKNRVIIFFSRKTENEAKLDPWDNNIKDAIFNWPNLAIV